jgi:hypothetical protein
MRTMSALVWAVVFSGIVAFFVLVVVGTLGFPFGYPGIALALFLSISVWVGGTIYFTRALYRTRGEATEWERDLASSNLAGRDNGG